MASLLSQNTGNSTYSLNIRLPPPMYLAVNKVVLIVHIENTYLSKSISHTHYATHIVLSAAVWWDLWAFAPETMSCFWSLNTWSDFGGIGHTGQLKLVNSSMTSLNFLTLPQDPPDTKQSNVIKQISTLLPCVCYGENLSVWGLKLQLGRSRIFFSRMAKLPGEIGFHQ